MIDKYQNKYRIASTRASWHGYNGGVYFVTICTKNKAHYFGEIKPNENDHCTDAECRDAKFCVSTNHADAKFCVSTNTDSDTEPIMQLSEIGKCAAECWNAISAHFPHVELGPFVVMPNHIHGILFINQCNDIVGPDVEPVETQNFASLQTTQTQNITIQTQNIASVQKFGSQSRNLAFVIRGFKIGVTKYAHTNNIEFAWQPRFYDRIVRNHEELNRIAQYIENNIARWADDELNNNN